MTRTRARPLTESARELFAGVEASNTICIGQPLSHFDQTRSQEIFEQGQQVALAPLGFDIIFLQQNLVDIGNLTRRLQQFPNLGADGVESIVNAVFHIQDGRFRAEITRHLVLCDRDYGLPRKAHSLVS